MKLRCRVFFLCIAAWYPLLTIAAPQNSTESSDDARGAISDKLSREKSLGVTRKSTNSDRKGREDFRDHSTESGRGTTKNFKKDLSGKREYSFRYNAMVAILEGIKKHENTGEIPNLKSCRLLSSYDKDYPLDDWGNIRWHSDIRGNSSRSAEMRYYYTTATQPGGGTFLSYYAPSQRSHSSAESQFRPLKNWIGCWVYYGELIAKVAERLPHQQFGQHFPSEGAVMDTAEQLILELGRDPEIRNNVKNQLDQIRSCGIPSVMSSFSGNATNIIVNCGQIIIRPLLGIAEYDGIPLFDGRSVQGRTIEVALTDSASFSASVDRSAEYRERSNQGSRVFDRVERGTDTGTEAGMTRRRTSEESESVDSGDRATQSITVSPNER